MRLIDMLGAAGLRRIELTSFVRPDVIPQLADAEQVLASYERRPGVAYSVLIPNERGLDRALAQRERFDEVNLFLSASETHNRRNVNRSIAESLAGLERVIAARPGRGAALRGRDLDQLRLSLRGRGAGRPRAGDRRRRSPRPAARRSPSATPRGWRTRVRWASSSPPRASACPRSSSPPTSTTPAGRGSPTRSRRSSRASTSFESAFGELGGCPVPPGSTGNISTEDLVSMLEEMGVDTGVDLARLLAASTRRAGPARPPARRPPAHRRPDRLAPSQQLTTNH